LWGEVSGGEIASEVLASFAQLIRLALQLRGVRFFRFPSAAEIHEAFGGGVVAFLRDAVDLKDKVTVRGAVCAEDFFHRAFSCVRCDVSSIAKTHHRIKPYRFTGG
jgi:hypothetical protein